MSEQKNPVALIKEFGNNPAIMARFKEVLKDRAPQFMADVINAVRNSRQLQACDPNSIWGGAMVAAALDISINPNLGQAAIVPYKDKAQFQMMARGFIQLAMRTGQYAKMNSAPVNEGVFCGYDEIGEPIIDWQKWDATKPTAGFVFAFKLVNGFSKIVYWSKERVEDHAKKYSSAYRYALEHPEKKKDTIWCTNFDAMGEKTVVKHGLSKWGILSIEMRKAIEADQAEVNPTTGDVEYIDNKKDVVVPAVED